MGLHLFSQVRNLAAAKAFALALLSLACSFEVGGLEDLWDPTLYATEWCDDQAEPQDLPIGQELQYGDWTCVVGDLRWDTSTTECRSTSGGERTLVVQCGEGGDYLDVADCRVHVQCEFWLVGES